MTEYLVFVSVLVLTYLGSLNSDFDIKTPKKTFFLLSNLRLHSSSRKLMFFFFFNFFSSIYFFLLLSLQQEIGFGRQSKVFLIDFFSLFFSSFIEQDLHQLGPDFNPRTSFLKKKGRHHIYKCTINFIVVLIFWLNICYYFLDYL